MAAHYETAYCVKCERLLEIKKVMESPLPIGLDGVASRMQVMLDCSHKTTIVVGKESYIGVLRHCAVPALAG